MKKSGKFDGKTQILVIFRGYYQIKRNINKSRHMKLQGTNLHLIYSAPSNSKTEVTLGPSILYSKQVFVIFKLFLESRKTEAVLTDTA